MKYIFCTIIVFFGVSVISNASNDLRDQQKCNKINSKKIDLTGDNKPETIWISVYGKNCKEAKYNISIKSGDGMILYKFSHFFTDMYVAHTYKENETNHQINRLIKDIFKHGIKNEMPPIEQLPHRSEIDGIGEVRYISKKEYLKLKSYKLPYFFHYTWYEGAAFITYDPTTKKFITFGGI